MRQSTIDRIKNSLKEIQRYKKDRNKKQFTLLLESQQIWDRWIKELEQKENKERK